MKKYRFKTREEQLKEYDRLRNWATPNMDSLFGQELTEAENKLFYTKGTFRISNKYSSWRVDPEHLIELTSEFINGVKQIKNGLYEKV